MIRKYPTNETKRDETMTTKRQDAILALLKQQGASSREGIADSLDKLGQTRSKATLLRDLDRLASAGLIEKSGTGKATRYALSLHSALTLPIDARAYFSKEADERELRSEYFNFALFQELHHLLTEGEIAELTALNDVFRQKKARLTPGLLQKELERLTVELAWKSSKIEGNTYTLLDTERLLKEHISAAGKTAEETQMLLNHKKALDYVLEDPAHYKKITVAKIIELHSLLTAGLHVASGIRTGMVGIVGTNYRPLDNQFQIRDALEELAAMLNRTAHAIEKAMLAVLLISYIQPFEDGNKRTSRILGNAVLLANDFCPLSYRSVDEIEYKKAIILFYEQNNISSFKKLFLEQFRMAVDMYF